ncbi:MAG TPA: 16S rRNA (guanine(966)-N(2))-methyltransferase RsmD [Gammaproteobacteria bacterium]|nr:16S rRNA (guanine(966)-N(2))-methyltransferase RsmD [Gammaproteobacteria bacterium]
MKQHNPGRGYRNEFRIIAGVWRRRKLKFPPLPGIRPSPDRVRETLFNWLMDHVAGARCLDLFAGSGALGLEALSRGAAEAVFVDRERAALDAIRAHLELLKARGGTLVQADALAWLETPATPFDIVFLDPPFDAQLLPRVCELLERGRWLKPGAHIYMEYPAERPPAVPAHWTRWREGHAGRVGFRLMKAAV